MKNDKKSQTTTTKKKSDFGITCTELNRLVKTCSDANVSEITLPNGIHVVFKTGPSKNDTDMQEKLYGRTRFMPYKAPATPAPDVDLSKILIHNEVESPVSSELNKELLYDELMDLALSDPMQYEELVSEQMSRDSK